MAMAVGGRGALQKAVSMDANSISFAYESPFLVAGGTGPGADERALLRVFRTTPGGYMLPEASSSSLPAAAGRICRVAWSKPLAPSFPAGLVAGGLDGGGLVVWKPHASLEPSGSSSSSDISFHLDESDDHDGGRHRWIASNFEVIEDHFSVSKEITSHTKLKTGEETTALAQPLNGFHLNDPPDGDARYRWISGHYNIIPNYFAAPDPDEQASPLTKRDDGVDPDMLYLRKRHSGAVNGLSFNQNAPNLLVSGAGHGKISVWDLGKASRESTCTFEGVLPSALDVEDLSWCPFQTNVFASAGGTPSIWDTRAKKNPVKAFKSSKKSTAVNWSPFHHGWIMCAVDDETGSPCVMLWDTREEKQAVKFCENSQGASAMAWSLHEKDRFLVCTKDREVLMCNVQKNKVEITSGIHTSHVCSDVQWSPSTEGLFATAANGGITLHTLSIF